MRTVEIEIPQVTVEQVVKAMAESLLGEPPEYDEDDSDAARWSRKEFSQKLRSYLDNKIAELADKLIRERFDAVVAARIEAAVDEVLTEGWYRTDDYGQRRGERLSLKERISEFIKSTDRYNQRNVVDERIKATIDKQMHDTFAPVIAAAGQRLKLELDAAIVAKFAETVRNALGIC